VRILLLSWEFVPRVYGGLGRHVTGLAKTLAGLGHDVMVVTTGTSDAPPAEVLDGVAVHRVVGAPFDLASGGWLDAVRADNEAMLDVALGLPLPEDTIVHVHDWMAGDAGMGLADRRGLPLVATIHATERGRHQGWLPGELSRRIDAQEHALVHTARRVITCSRWMRAKVTATFRLPPGKVAVAPNGVGDEDVPGVEAAGTNPGTPVIAFAGRLEYEKGVHVLLEAVAGLDHAHVVLAGQGTRQEALERQAAGLGLAERVRFAGFLDRGELAALYRGATVVAVPSLYEPFGLVALEAMYAGAPVVASRVGGLPEVLGDGAGLLVPADDPVVLARALRQVLTDGGLAASLGTAGRRRARTRFTWETAAERVVEAYRSVAASP
jgi:glycogen synthase